MAEGFADLQQVSIVAQGALEQRRAGGTDVSTILTLGDSTAASSLTR